MGSSPPRRRSGAAALAALALVVVPVALAVEQQPIRFNAADQAAAKAATLKLSDFDVGYGWKGGAKKPDLSSDNDWCATKVSDLVVTGAAKSDFTSAAARIKSETQVLRTAAMVAADWQRTIGNPAVMACVRRELFKPQPDFKLISFQKLAFPKLARYVTRFRMVADYGKPGSSIRALVDIVLLGQGRTEVTLTLSVPYADRAAVDAAERRLAQILIGRIAE